MQRVFLKEKQLQVSRIVGVGFDGVSAFSGKKTGVQQVITTCLVVHCHCNLPQLACVQVANSNVCVTLQLCGSLALLSMWGSWGSSCWTATQAVWRTECNTDRRLLSKLFDCGQGLDQQLDLRWGQPRACMHGWTNTVAAELGNTWLYFMI